MNVLQKKYHFVAQRTINSPSSKYALGELLAENCEG